MLTDEQIAQFHRDGFLIYGNVLRDDELTSLRDALDRVVRGQSTVKPEAMRNMSGGDDVVIQIVNIWQAEPAFFEHLYNDRLVPLAAQLMNTDTVRVWHDQIQIKPSYVGGPTLWHQDHPYWPVIQPADLVSAWVALEDATVDNGCMSMVPGSHLWGAFKGGTVGSDSSDWGPAPEAREFARNHADGSSIEPVPLPAPGGGRRVSSLSNMARCPAQPLIPQSSRDCRPLYAGTYALRKRPSENPHGRTPYYGPERRNFDRGPFSHRDGKRASPNAPERNLILMSVATMNAPSVAGTTANGNEPFAYKQKTFAIDDLAGMTAAMHEDGFALVPGVLSPTEVQNVRDAIDRLQPFGFDKLGITDHFKCVFNREKVFLDMIDREPTIDLAEATMGEQCHIIGETAWRSHPGHNAGRRIPTVYLWNCPKTSPPIRVSNCRSTSALRTIIWTI